MLAFIGGTGPEGKGLALRLALAGEAVVIGSRNQERAQDAAQSLLEQAPDASITGDVNATAAQQADIVFVTTPYEGQRPTLEALSAEIGEKIVVNTVAPMEFSDGRARALDVEDGSAALEAQSILPGAKVVAAFQNASAVDLMEAPKTMEGDVIVCSDDRAAKETVMELVTKIPGLRPVDGGALANSKYVENLTPLLVNINRRYKAHSTIKIVGI